MIQITTINFTQHCLLYPSHYSDSDNTKSLKEKFILSEHVTFQCLKNQNFVQQFILKFFPPYNILPNLMFLYTVTTLKDAIHWLFILGLTVAERK